MFGLVSLLLYFFQDRMIFFPQRTSERVRDLYKSNEITVSHDGIKLHGWFVKEEISAASPLLVYYGGNAEDISMNLEDSARFGNRSFLFMNYRGYGDSQGRPSEKHLVEDAIAILDHITASERIDPAHMVLMGRSLGSGVAVQVAARRKVGRVILVTPFDSLVNVARKHYPLFPVKLMLRHRFDSASLAPYIKIPALAIVAGKDQVIPGASSMHLVEKWGGPIETVTIENADHNDIGLFALYWKAINEFLTKKDGQ